MAESRPAAGRSAQEKDDGPGVHHVVLEHEDGTPVSLRRFRGCWVIVHINDRHDCLQPVSDAQCLDATLLHVTLGSVPAADNVPNYCGSFCDPEGVLAQFFPNVQWPASMLISPTGALVTIGRYLDYPHLAQMLKGVCPPVFGAVDGADLIG